MIPGRNQFRRWQLPTQWSFLASIATLIGLIVAILAFLASFYLPIADRQESGAAERRTALFTAGHELRHNSELIAEILTDQSQNGVVLGAEPYSTEATQNLLSTHYDQLTEESLGEDRYLYQQLLLLNEWLSAIQGVRSKADVRKWDANSSFTVADVLFLNDFIWWYLHPAFQEHLPTTKFRSPGYPDKPFQDAIASSQTRRFTHEGERLEFVGYLGLLD